MEGSSSSDDGDNERKGPPPSCHDVSARLSSLRTRNGVVQITFRTVPLATKYVLVPHEDQLNVLPTISDLHLRHYWEHEILEGPDGRLTFPSHRTITMNTLKQVLHSFLRDVHGWELPTSDDLILNSDGVSLYDSWSGDDVGLGTTTTFVTYKCLELTRSVISASITSNDGGSRGGSSDGGENILSETSHEQRIHRQENRKELRRMTTNIRTHMHELRLASAKVQASVGATFKQVARDLEVFVMHVLSVVVEERPAVRNGSIEKLNWHTTVSK